jgi:hypothetical protein
VHCQHCGGSHRSVKSNYIRTKNLLILVGAMLNVPGVAEKKLDQFLVPQVILEWGTGTLSLILG